MKYILSFLFALLLFACNQQEEKPTQEIQGLFAPGDTVTFTTDPSTGKLIASTPGKQVIMTITESKDTFYTVITQEAKTGTYSYYETLIDTFTKKYAGPVVTPPKDTTTIPPSTGTRNNILFSALFNGSNPFDPNLLYKQACCSYSVTQSKTVLREGDGSFRAESRSGDPKASGGYRPEFIPPTNTRLVDGWYGYSVYLEDWKACNCGEHIMQWHPNDGEGSAVLALWTAANTFNVNLNASGGTSSSGLKSLANSITIKPNKWYDFVWHVVWSSDRTKGRIEVWVDGVKYVDFTGVTLPPSGIPYFKIGINRWNMSENRVLYIDAVRIGNASATYKDVAP